MASGAQAGAQLHEVLLCAAELVVVENLQDSHQSTAHAPASGCSALSLENASA
jgi:hypothetical protein